MSDTQVSDVGLSNLEGLSRLETLDLSGTQVGSAGLAAIDRVETPGIARLVTDERRTTTLSRRLLNSIALKALT